MQLLTNHLTDYTLAVMSIERDLEGYRWAVSLKVVEEGRARMQDANVIIHKPVIHIPGEEGELLERWVDYFKMEGLSEDEARELAETMVYEPPSF